MAQQRQDRRGEVQAATASATGLACFIFRFLRRPLLGRQRTEAAHIKPRHAGGEPDVTNGILLRSDIHIGIYCLAGIIRGNRVKIPKEQDMPCTLQLTMIYVGITFFLIVGYICHQIT
ncbi:HNH endonuclease [Escherichia coli]|uniref:HNH endonuclease n=1 Tax=Escherichia coli TaxID=562 RepID=UPI000909342A